VLFDLGTNPNPLLFPSHYYDDVANIGGLVFEHGGQEYLVANRFPGCSGTAGLYRFNGLELADLELVQCLTAGSSNIDISGGFYLGDDGDAYVYAVDTGDNGHVFAVTSGPTVVLTYLGTPFHAPLDWDQGLALDTDAGLAATARNGIIALYDITSPASPVEITSWRPDPAARYSSVALDYPYLWVSERGLRETLMYSVRRPTLPERIAEDFWEYEGAGAQPWNTYPCMDNRHAVFTDDGAWLFVARFSVLERFQVLDTCLPLLDAEFDWAPKPAMVGLPVTFTDLSFGELISWAWDFGDGVGTSTEQNPTYTFAEVGTFAVTLAVSDGSETSTASHAVEVVAAPDLTGLYFIPAAAAGSGAAGSHWLTDLELSNAGAAAVSYDLWWLPRDTDNSSPATYGEFTLGAGMSVRYSDLVTAFGETGFGAAAVDADSPDVLIMSRTFNQPVDTQAGTFGQSIPGYRADRAIQAGSRVRLLFMTENGDFRSNCGLLNATAEAITVNVELFGADGASLGTDAIGLPGYGNTQLNQLFDPFAPLVAGYIDIWTEAGAFIAYGSVVDNATSDPTTVLPQELPE